MSSTDTPSQPLTPRSHLLRDKAYESLLKLGFVFARSDNALIFSRRIYGLETRRRRNLVMQYRMPIIQQGRKSFFVTQVSFNCNLY
jgi:hypothetical protein